jgi:hypothetical protein
MTKATAVKIASDIGGDGAIAVVAATVPTVPTVPISVVAISRDRPRSRRKTKAATSRGSPTDPQSRFSTSG